MKNHFLRLFEDFQSMWIYFAKHFLNGGSGVQVHSKARSEMYNTVKGNKQPKNGTTAVGEPNILKKIIKSEIR